MAHIKRKDGEARYCLQCGYLYTVYTQKHKQNRWCSPICRRLYQSNRDVSLKVDKPKPAPGMVYTICVGCDGEMKAYRTTKRPFCSKECRLNYLKRLTKKDIESVHISSTIRKYNREWNRDITIKPCANCGYSKHVELAHIVAVSEFSDDVPFGIINSPDNILPLCPTCHWEFDTGILTREALQPWFKALCSEP